MEDLNTKSVGRWAGQRALSTPTAAIIMIVVILVVGGLGYVGLNAAKQNPVTKSACNPPSAAVCVQGSAAHDVSLLVPFKAVQQNSTVPFTASLPNGEVATSFTFNFGDGTNDTTAAPTSSHVYNAPGTYIASVTATVKGAVHDSYKNLAIISVTASFASASAGNLPGITGTIVTNSTPTAGSATTAILQPGGSVTLLGTYSSAPTNPLFALVAPDIVPPTSGVTASNPVATSSSAGGTFTFANSGVFWVSFVAKASSGTGGTTVSQNFTWTVFVAPNGLHAGIVQGATSGSLHKNALSVYELIPGGGHSEDPAIDYDTAGYEPIVNVYEALIAYNGSQTGPSFSSYVPVAATCVPGSDVGPHNCATLYGGNTLLNGSDFTFVISPDATFYDPASQVSWGMYPSDVMFSLARTMAFATSPYVGANNGWLITQALLQYGNGSWSGAGSLHNVYNNTPQQVLGSMTINGTDCPATAISDPSVGHGCITFHAVGSGTTWPFFLELISDQLGSSIVPCGWFSAAKQAAWIPGWTDGIASSNPNDKGDHPCGAPGTAGYGDPTTQAPTFWDTWETLGANQPYFGNVRYSMAGSGPYMLQAMQPAISYTLAASPGYKANSNCNWKGCYPQPGKYAASVSVTYESTAVPGEQAYAAGAADAASIPGTDTAFLLQLIQQGKISAAGFPSISIYFFPFNFAFDIAQTTQWTSNPITVPTDWFSHVGMRQFFARAYPYTTIAQTILTKDGLQYGFNYGGAIPQFMANYYPTNVSFPSTDPVASASVTGSAGWWWSQMTTVGSPYYDSEAAACSASTPCQLPLFGETGAPSLDQQMALWVAEISSLTGGAVKVSPIDVNFNDLLTLSLGGGAYTNPMPVFTLGWAPDYPDPTDYITPLFQGGGTYMAGDAVSNQVALPAFNDPSCHPASLSDWTWWSNQAQTNGVSDNCQGAAFAAMQIGMGVAATMAPGDQRVLAYAEIEQIANALAFYVYQYQSNVVVTTASYLDPTSMNSNVTIGGGGDASWYTVTGDGIPT